MLNIISKKSAIIGKAGVGKSRLALKEVHDKLKENDIIYISEEMTKQEVEAIILSYVIQEKYKCVIPDFYILDKEHISKDARIKINDAIEELNNYSGKLYVVEASGEIPKDVFRMTIDKADKNTSVFIDVNQSQDKFDEDINFIEMYIKALMVGSVCWVKYNSELITDMVRNQYITIASVTKNEQDITVNIYEDGCDRKISCDIDGGVLKEKVNS